jgi:enterochelin esterase-like enzyme
VVTESDTQFRTLADRQHRAVGGLSMGGAGALQLAINYPAIFGIAGAHSPSLHSYGTAPAYFGDSEYFARYDPASLYAANPATARTLTLWLDDGRQDEWFPVINAFHQELLANAIPHEWHDFIGGHGGDYWSGHVIDYLLFYSGALTTAAPATAPPALSPSPTPTGTATPTPPPAPPRRPGPNRAPMFAQ